MTDRTTQSPGALVALWLFVALLGCTSFAAVSMIVSPSPAHGASLPPEILKDKYQIVLERHLATHSYDRAARYMERLAALRAEHGVELDPGFEYKRAEVHYQLRQYEQTAAYLTDYLTTAGKAGTYYQQALTLLVDAETAAEDAAAQRDAAQNRRNSLERARITTNQVAQDAANQQILMEQQARQATIEQMARQRQAEAAAEAATAKAKLAPPPVDTRLTERRAALARQFTELINNFRYDAEAQAVDGNPGRRYIFRLQANIAQQAQAGPGICEMSFSSDGGFMVDRTPLTHAGTREKTSERVAQAQVKTTITGFDAVQLGSNTTEQLHKAFNVYTFSAGTEQKIQIHGAGGYMLRLYDIATAWSKACRPQLR
jgi:hypothetical protein